MRTALYLRVSTIHQKPDLQADSLRHYTIRAGLEIVAEYLDVAISGRKEGRPQLQDKTSDKRWVKIPSFLRSQPAS
jgi:DNA invertase Pin-like site-specific DNA recombinase